MYSSILTRLMVLSQELIFLLGKRPEGAGALYKAEMPVPFGHGIGSSIRELVTGSASFHVGAVYWFVPAF